MGARADRIVILRRSILAFACVALIWAAVVAVTGGFVIDTAWLRLSSRDPLRPLVAGVALLLLYGLRFRGEWRTDTALLARVPWPMTCAFLAAGTTLTAGLALTTTIAGGPDASGFVSQAALFAAGRLTRPMPEWAARAPWNDPPSTASPVGYRPSSRTEGLAPTYPPGLSIVMAVAHIVGGPSAVFVVVPIMGAIAVWATFLLGSHTAGRWEGAIASVLLALSPTFLTMLLQPMSDVPAMACWVLALLAAVRRRPAAAGLAVALALLIRPNLAPAAIVPAALLLAGAQRMHHAVVFACTVAPGAAIVAGLNWHYYGSPLQTGYGPLAQYYAIDHVMPNAMQYGRWLVTTQTPFIALWLLMPFVRRSAPDRGRLLAVTMVFPVVIVAQYLPYLIFHPFEWWYLRFLLPAYPAIFIGLAAVVVTVAQRMRPRALAPALPILIVAVIGWHGWTVAAQAEMLGRKRGDQRYARAVAFVERLPRDAVIVSLSHSGTISHYTGRDVLRFEALDGSSLDRAVAHLAGLGKPTYFVGDPFEVEMLREQFRGSTTLDALQSGPLADLGGAVVYLLRP
jgi:hypothetical protein